MHCFCPFVRFMPHSYTESCLFSNTGGKNCPFSVPYCRTAHNLKYGIVDVSLRSSDMLFPNEFTKITLKWETVVRNWENVSRVSRTCNGNGLSRMRQTGYQCGLVDRLILVWAKFVPNSHQIVNWSVTTSWVRPGQIKPVCGDSVCFSSQWKLILNMISSRPACSNCKFQFVSCKSPHIKLWCGKLSDSEHLRLRLTEYSNNLREQYLLQLIVHLWTWWFKMSR